MFAHVLGTHNQRQFWSHLTILLALGITLAAAPLALARTSTEEKCDGPIKRAELSRAQAVRVLGKFSSYTQGLIFSGNELYESAGLPGRSGVNVINISTGMPQTVLNLSGNFQAGGLTMINGEIYQLAKNQKVIFHHRGEDTEILPLQNEGVGLTSYNDQLVMSDSGTHLKFVDPKTMKVTHEVQNHRGNIRFRKLSELEMAKGNILGNIADTDLIGVIRPQDGCIMGVIDVSALRAQATREQAKDAKCEMSSCKPEDFATNGIAYDAANDNLYITGRNWPYIFVFKFPVEL